MANFVSFMSAGAKVVSMKKFEPNSFLAAVQKYRVTVLPLVPPIVLFLCKSPLVKDYDLSSVREIFSGAAPLGKEQAEEVTAKLGINCLRQGQCCSSFEDYSHARRTEWAKIFVGQGPKTKLAESQF